MTKDLETELCILKADRALDKKRGFSLHEADAKIKEIEDRMQPGKIRKWAKHLTEVRNTPVDERIQRNSDIRIQDLIRLIAKARHDKKKSSHFEAELKEIRIYQLSQDNIRRYAREERIKQDKEGYVLVTTGESVGHSSTESIDPITSWTSVKTYNEGDQVLVSKSLFDKPTKWQKIKTFFGWGV